MTIPIATKRQKFTLVSCGLALVMALSLYLPTWQALLVLVIASYTSTCWSLEFDLKSEEWLSFPLYAVLATLTAYFLLVTVTPSGWMLGSGVVIFGLVIYGLLLTLNILNIATVKSIPLSRPATSVMAMAGFGMAFILYWLAIRMQPTYIEWLILIVFLTLGITWPLVWQAAPLAKRFRRSLQWSLLVTVICLEIAAVSAFIPSSFMTAAVLAAVVYISSGSVHHILKRQPIARLQYQYWLVTGALIVILLWIK